MKRLIVNADDLGLCTGTVTGILHGHRHGIITSTSIMFTTPAAGRGVEMARAHPSLDAGVHLTFVEGRPVLPVDWVPSLVNEQGCFPTSEEWMAGRRRMDMGELEAEFKGQISLTRQAGLPISHLDLHTSAGYVLPGVFELSLKLAAENGLAIRLPFGEGWEKMMGQGVAAAIGVPLAQVKKIVEYFLAKVAEMEVPHPDRFIDAFADPAALTGEGLARLIAGLGEGTSELLTHPAHAAGCTRSLGDGTHPGGSTLTAPRRAAELAALCDPAGQRCHC